MPKLVNVKLDLKLPGIGGVAGTWEPDESEVRAAWELYVEMVTRTPLGGYSFQEGSLREALNSIYSLFDTTRRNFEKVWACRGSAKEWAQAVLWVPCRFYAESGAPSPSHGVASEAPQLGTRESTPRREDVGEARRLRE